MGNYAFDFSNYKPWTEKIMDLEYDSCATCGGMVPIGLERCYECEFYKPHIEHRSIKVIADIAEALCMLD